MRFVTKQYLKSKVLFCVVMIPQNILSIQQYGNKNYDYFKMTLPLQQRKIVLCGSQNQEASSSHKENLDRNMVKMHLHLPISQLKYGVTNSSHLEQWKISKFTNQLC